MTELHPPRPSPAAVVAAYENIVRYNYSPNPDFRWPNTRGYHTDTIAEVADEDNRYEVGFEIYECASDLGYYGHLDPNHEDYELDRQRADDGFAPYIDLMLERLRAEVEARPMQPIWEVEERSGGMFGNHILTLGFLRKITADLPDDTQVTIPTPPGSFEGDWLNVSHVWLPGDETGFSVQLVTEDSFDSRQQ